MKNRLRNDGGQALLMTVIFLTVLLGATALTLDVGDWYREQRQAQATADAAALAGAQALPTNPAQAYTLAQQYANSNGGGVSAGGITLSGDYQPNDTVSVNVTRNPPGFFSKLFGINTVTVTATAAARADVPEQVTGAAPIVVNKLHPELSGPGCPCFNVETTIPLAKNGAPGAFDLVNLDPNAPNGSTYVASWIQYGYAGYLDLGDYFSNTGAKFNSTGIGAALTVRIGTELLFPVYDVLVGTGSTAAYHVVGWVAFHLDCFGLPTGVTDCANNHGNNSSLTGYFTRVIWDGIQSNTNQNLPDFGVYSVSLVN